MQTRSYPGEATVTKHRVHKASKEHIQSLTRTQTNYNSRNAVINPFRPNELFYLSGLDRSISSIRDIWLVLLLLLLLLSCFGVISELNANSVDPHQTPQNAASNQGLHCLPMSVDAKLGLNGLTTIGNGIHQASRSHCTPNLSTRQT